MKELLTILSAMTGATGAGLILGAWRSYMRRRLQRTEHERALLYTLVRLCVKHFPEEADTLLRLSGPSYLASPPADSHSS